MEIRRMAFVAHFGPLFRAFFRHMTELGLMKIGELAL